MKLYVCWNTDPGPRDLHPCGKAHRALKEAGHEPEVVKARGFGFLPDLFNRTAGRQEARSLSGSSKVPVLVTDTGEVICESSEIVYWARKNPASQSATASTVG